jgi:osmotically inducible protein OsmC
MPDCVAHATTVGGRNGHVETSDGLLKADLSIPKSIGGAGKVGTSNPEQFFAAGYSACFGGSVEYAAYLEKVKAGPVTVTADVTLHVKDADFRLSVHLKTHVDGVDRATAERLVAKAHNEICTYSKATCVVVSTWRSACPRTGKGGDQAKTGSTLCGRTDRRNSRTLVRKTPSSTPPS